MRCDVSTLALKKTRVARERDCAARLLFQEQMQGEEVERLVFLDECGFASNLSRLYGWAIGGARCMETSPHTRTQNRSCLGAFSLPCQANPTGLWALWQKNGAWNGLLFELFIMDELLPRLPPASVLVLDNARIHKSHALQQAVEAAGHRLLFLPAYSPDFNPIELVWNWLKNWVRHCAPEGDEPRKQAIRAAQAALPPKHAQAWFRKCGLTPSLPE